MNSIGIVLIARLGMLIGIANVNYAKRDMMLGKIKAFLKINAYSLLRISAAPHSSKSKVYRAQKNVLYRGRAILYPILRKWLG